jgi:hypothetical protein
MTTQHEPAALPLRTRRRFPSGMTNVGSGSKQDTQHHNRRQKRNSTRTTGIAIRRK